jgi:PRC-barrel domain
MERKTMNQIRLLATSIGIGLLILHLSAAQAPSMGQSVVTAATPTSVPAGSLQRVQNDWRARNVIGASVFNETGQRIATIRDMLITDDGKVDKVVLAVRQGGKVVAVGFSELQFLPSQRFDTPVLAVRGRMSRMVSAAHTERRPYGVMLPGATQHSLTEMESFPLTP